MLKVCAIVVTFNRLHILKKCLNHLLHQSYKVSSIVVIDNNSSDGTSEYLKNLNNPIIQYKILNKNIGGSGGFSLGTKFAFEHSKAKYFWVMDDDALPTVNSLKALVISSKILKYDFGFLCSNVRSLNDLPVNVPKVSKDWTKYLPKGLIKIRQASFVSLFFSRNIVAKLGLPIKQMFIWGDDFEYTSRISNKHESYFVPNSLIIHDSVVLHDNSKKSEDIFNTKRPKFYEYSYRNYLYNARKYYGLKGALDRFIKDIGKLMEVPFLSKDKRCKRFYYVLSGIIKGLFFNPKIEFPKYNNINNLKGRNMNANR